MQQQQQLSGGVWKWYTKLLSILGKYVRKIRVIMLFKLGIFKILILQNMFKEDSCFIILVYFMPYPTFVFDIVNIVIYYLGKMLL